MAAEKHRNPLGASGGDDYESQIRWQSRYIVAAAIMLALSWSAAVSGFFISADNAVDEIAREQVVWSALQTEVEFHRLINAIERGRAQGDESGAEAVSLRADILISRLGVHESGEVGARLRESLTMNSVVEELRAVVNRYQHVLYDFETASEQDRQELAIALQSMEPEMRRGARQVSSQEASRLLNVRKRIRFARALVIAATAVVVLGAGLFLATLRRSLRRAEALATRNHRLAVHAEAGRRAKADFLATMSHEIRTPLNGVLGMLAALEDSGLREDQESYARIARSSATSLLALLSEVLDDVRLEEGRLALSHEPTRLADLFADVFAIVAPRAWEERIELSYAIDPALPECVMADAGRLRQILLNLVSNAVKFTREGGVAGWARLENTPEGKRLLIQVADSGPGVSPEDTARIFGRFDRGRNQATERMDGVGLGLAISARLVGAFGGDIGVEPRDEGGSLFWFSIPLVPVETVSDEPATAGPPRLDGRRIAFMRSSRVGPTALDGRLRDLGATVTVVSETQDAIALLRSGEAESIMLIGDERADAIAHEILDTLGNDTRIAVLRCDPPRGARDARLAARGAFISSTPFATDGFRFLAGQRGPGAGDAEQAAGRRLVGLEVLVSEDQPVNQMVVAMHLRRESANPTLAGDGAEAVEVAARNRFDAILLDLHTPRMNGIEAARTIREGDGPNARTPIIALTADATATARREFLAVGVTHVATKPVSREALARIILQAMGRDAKGSTAAEAAPETVSVADPRLSQRAAAEFVRLAERLEDAAAREDDVAVRAACHDAIGAAGFLGLSDLSELAEMVRVAAVEGDPVWIEAAQDLSTALRSADPKTFRA